MLLDCETIKSTVSLGSNRTRPQFCFRDQNTVTIFSTLLVVCMPRPLFQRGSTSPCVTVEAHTFLGWTDACLYSCRSTSNWPTSYCGRFKYDIFIRHILIVDVLLFLYRKVASTCILLSLPARLCQTLRPMTLLLLLGKSWGRRALQMLLWASMESTRMMDWCKLTTNWSMMHFPSYIPCL